MDTAEERCPDMKGTDALDALAPLVRTSFTLEASRIIVAIVQRRVLQYRGYCLWQFLENRLADEPLAESIPVIPDSHDEKLANTLVFRGVSCWFSSIRVPPPTVPRQRGRGIHADLCSDLWDDDKHHPAPDCLHSKRAPSS